jgi:hypothetical protein
MSWYNDSFGTQADLKLANPQGQDKRPYFFRWPECFGCDWWDFTQPVLQSVRQELREEVFELLLVALCTKRAVAGGKPRLPSASDRCRYMASVTDWLRGERLWGTPLAASERARAEDNFLRWLRAH